jgi:urocanate hydratase
MCFDYGFGPFRWVCFRKTGGFTKTDTIACQVLEEMAKTAPIEIQQQMQDNIQWIKGAQENKLVVGSREILYADAEGRVKIALIRLLPRDIGTIVLGRDHHDVSGTLLTGDIKHLRRIAFADMAIQNVIGDSSVALLGYPFTMAAE